MALRSIAQLKSWFKRGIYPTAAHFADWMDSYWHKEEKIPINSVDNLSNHLNNKYAKSDGDELERKQEELIIDFNEHCKSNTNEFDVVYKSVKKLKDDDVLIVADIATIHEDITDLQGVDIELQAAVVNLHDKDSKLQTSLANAHTNLSTISEMMRGGATLAGAKAALVELGPDYKDLYSVANTLKTALNKKEDNPMAGRYWNENNSSPTASGYYGSLEALKELPKKMGLGRYLVTDDRVRHKLDPEDSTLFADGSPANLDGTMGQCMWSWNSHYYTSWKEGDNTVEVVTFLPIEGKKSIFVPAGGLSWIGAGVFDSTENKLCSVISTNERYRGGNGSVLNCPNLADDAPQKTGLGMPRVMLPQGSYSTYARKRGKGWEANWFVARSVLEYSLRIILGTRNSQAPYNPLLDNNGLFQGGLGAGANIGTSNWGEYNDYYPYIPTNVGIEVGDHIGVVKYNIIDKDGTLIYIAPVPVFFGFVNPFGHVGALVGGEIVDVGTEKTRIYVAPSMYAAFDNTTTLGLLFAAELPSKLGHIKNYSTNLLCSFPTETGGSSETYFCDIFAYEPNAGIVPCIAGYGGGNDYDAGAFARATGGRFTQGDTGITAPLCYFSEDPKITQ